MKNIMHIIVSCGLCIINIIQLHASAPLTADDCRPGINTKKFFKGTPKEETLREFNCLKAGLKLIWIGTQNEYDQHKDILNGSTFKFGILTCHLNKERIVTMTKPNFESTSTPHATTQNVSEIIVYNTDAEKKALLFQKLTLEGALELYIDNLKKYTDPTNLFYTFRIDSSYSVGTFLGYPEEDITLFYQRRSINPTSPFRNDPQQVAAWAQKNLNHWKPELEKDKARHTKWLTLNEKYTIEELKKQNDSLNEAIQNFILIPTTSQKIIPAISQKTSTVTTTPWWKKIAITATIAAAGYALYSYFKKTGSSTQP